MIPLVKEPEEFYKELKVYEKCIFCNKGTPYWHTKTNRPICKEDAKKHKVADIKTAPYGY